MAPVDPKCSCIILCGGAGLRIQELTKGEMAKPLLPVAGRRLIDFALDLVDDTFVGQLIFAIAHLGDQLLEWMERQPAWCVPPIVSRQSAEGVIGAIAAARELVTFDTMLCLHADEIKPGLDLRGALRFHKASRAAATAVVTPSSRVLSHWVVRSEDQGRVVVGLDVHPKGLDPRHEELVLAGALFIEQRAWDRFTHVCCGGDYMSLVSPLIRSRQLHMWRSTCEVLFNVNTPAEYREAAGYFESSCDRGRLGP